MQIFLDARMFYHSGIGRYGRNLYQELCKISTSNKIMLGLDDQVYQRLQKEESWTPEVTPFNAPIYSLREQIKGSYLVRRRQRQFDLFHFPHYNIPYLAPSPLVVTCHDLIPLLFPQYFPSIKVTFAHYLLKQVAQQAKRIIVVSSHTQQDFLRFFPQAENKLRVIYNGVGTEFHPLSQTEVMKFKRQKQLGDFLLYIGNCKAHKNLPRLIAAYAHIKNLYPSLKLVILTQNVYNTEVAKAVAQWGVGKEVILHKPVDNRDLVRYYNAAQLFVFPSLYEGFGLPPLEAMACGTPVVASMSSSIPEVVGNAAILVDPSDINSITTGIAQGLNDSDLRGKLRQAGLERAKEFTWQKTAKQTWQVYKEIVQKQ